MDEQDIRLDKARRQVAEAELRVVRQQALVETFTRQGRSTEKAEQQLAVLKTALDTMRVDINRYPTQDEGLALLMQADPRTVTGWAGPYLGGALPADPWRRPSQPGG